GGGGIAARVAAPANGPILAVRVRAPRPGSERWHVERLRALADSDRAAFATDVRRAFAGTPSRAESFASLRVALERDAALADEVGRALLALGRRTDRDLLAATVLVVDRYASRSNAAAQRLLATLSADEAPRHPERGVGEPESGQQ